VASVESSMNDVFIVSIMQKGQDVLRLALFT